MSDDGTGFYAAPHASLAAHGIGEQPALYCTGGTLQVRDAAGGAFDIAPERVERLRLGATRTKLDIYHQARLFLAGEAEPLLIRPRATRDPHYAATMRRFAHAVAAAGGIERIERGLTGRLALVGVLAVIPVAAGASLMALLVWSKEYGMAGAVAFTALMAGMVALLAWHALARERPRPVASLEELEIYLPNARR
jgi:hypothetical protein